MAEPSFDLLESILFNFFDIFSTDDFEIEN